MPSNAINSYVKTKNSPRSVFDPSAGEVQNNEGAFVFQASDVARLTRFLVLGTDGGTYYAAQRELTIENVDFIVDMIKADEQSVVDTVVDVSVNGRAPKNSQALFVLALVFAHGQDKSAAAEALNKVARTGTHLFEFVHYLRGLSGLGRAKRRAIASWYESKSPEAVGYQMAKYRSRYGYTHRDLLRLSHPSDLDGDLAKFALSGEVSDTAPKVLRAFESAQSVKSSAEAVKVIKNSEKGHAPWEFFPTEVHNSPDFWKAIFYAGMPSTALLRNLSRFARLGLFDDIRFTVDVADALVDEEAVRKGRMHPVQYVNAMVALGVLDASAHRHYYDSEILTIKLPKTIKNALEKALNLSFRNVKPSGKRISLSLDVSGSMQFEGIAGMSITPMVASAIMALTTRKVERLSSVNAFSKDYTSLDVSADDSINDVIGLVSDLPFDWTDVALPISKATQSGEFIDAFVIYTDNEVNYGKSPVDALREYRRKVNPEAKVVVVAMTPSPYTVFPDGDGFLNLSGFDSSAPAVISSFINGEI